MPELRDVSGEAAIGALGRLGFRRVHQRGSHVVLRKDMPGGSMGCVVPLHRVLAVGTLRGILKQAGVTAGEFLERL